MMPRTREPARRKAIVHYHIFKNAGTSIDRILQSAFGDRWASLEGATPTSLLRPYALEAFLSERPEILAVSSHLLRPPAPAGIEVLPLVLVRHPLDRAVSVYSQLRRGPSKGLESETVARQSTFAQFVLWCLGHKSDGGMVIADYQVVHLSPASFRNAHIYEAVATEDDLRHAISYLSAGACFGTVDQFDSMIVRLRRAASDVGFEMLCEEAEVSENVTVGRPGALEERITIAEAQLGQVLLRRFTEGNELDYRLYEWARDYQSRNAGSP
jgi:hypothetical protein